MTGHKLSFVMIALLTMILLGCENTAQKLEANKNLIQRFGEAVNTADWDTLSDLLTADFSRHCQATPDTDVKSGEEFIQLQKSFLASMPDQKVTIDMLIAEGNKVAVYATYSGTLTGPMGKFQPTGKSAESRFLAIFRIENDRIAEMWVEYDNMSMLTQLGLLPLPKE